MPTSWGNLNLYNMRISNKKDIPIPPQTALYKKDFSLKLIL